MAILSEADLTDAQNLTAEQVKAARNWEQARYSDEFLSTYRESLTEKRLSSWFLCQTPNKFSMSWGL